MQADGSNQRRVTQLSLTGNPQDSWPAWSPDGRRLAFTALRHSNGELFVINADGTQLTQILSTGEGIASPAWSPDGQRIAVAITGSPYPKLMSVKPDGSNLTELNCHFNTGWRPAWDASGTQLAFSNGTNIFVMGLDHTQPQQLTEVGTNTSPAWSNQ